MTKNGSLCNRESVQKVLNGEKKMKTRQFIVQ